MTEYTLKRAMDRLRANLNSKATLGQIAAELGMSEGHFARTFKQSTGYSPHQWSMIQRCELAKTLLRAGTDSFAQIAMQAGFADQAHFSRSFRLIVGVTPRQWRDGMIGKAP
jgi:AraC-like DNA-binding protein